MENGDCPLWDLGGHEIEGAPVQGTWAREGEKCVSGGET